MNKPASCVGCAIRNGEVFQKGDARFCHECTKMPCGRLKRLDGRSRAGYGMSMLENLESIKRNGVGRFAANEKARWACSG